MEETEEHSVPKSIRKSIERTVDLLIDNHDAFQANPFVISVDSIVENIIQSEEMQIMIANFQREKMEKSKRGEVISFESEDEVKYGIEYPGKDLELLSQTDPLHSIIDQKTWNQEAKVLRDQLLSKNNDVFLNSYKKHIMLITHPQTLNEGISNVIHATKLYFARASKQNVSNNFRISLRIGSHKNILKVVSLLIQALKFTSRNYKQSTVETIIVQLLELINFGNGRRKVERINVLNYFSILDPTAEWFKDLSYNTFNRNIILNYLLKNPSLLEYFVGEISMNKTLARNLDLDHTVKNFVFDDKSEILTIILRAATFSHSLHIVGEILCYNYSHKLPAVKLKSSDAPGSEFTLINIFLEVTLTFLEIPLQKLKSCVIIEILKKILIRHPYLFNFTEPRLLRILEPFNIDKSKQLAHETAVNVMYIYEICRDISKQDNGLSVLFNFNLCFTSQEKTKMKYKRFNVIDGPQNVNVTLNKIIRQYQMKDNDSQCLVDILCNFATTFLRHYMNNNKKYDMDESLPQNILNNIHQILTSEDHILNWYKCGKLLICVKNLYKFLFDQVLYDKILFYLEKILYSTCTVSNAMKVFDNDQDILFLFGSNYLESDNCKFWDEVHFYDFLLNMIENMYGCEAVFKRIKLIVNPNLYEIWNLMENQTVFISGSDRLTYAAISKFLQMILTFSFSLKCTQVILKESIDESVSQEDTNCAPMNLHDLIEDSLFTIGPGNIINFTGLMMIKVLITNLDIYLYLENKYNIQEKLASLQTHVQVHKNDRLSPVKETVQKTIQPYILDETSQLRHKILDHINSLGNFNVKNTPILVKKTISGSTMRKQVNEFQRFLKETKNNLHDNSWLHHCRRAHKLCLDDVIKEFVVIELIRQVKLFYPTSRSEFVWPNLDVELKDLHPEEKIAISAIVKFGTQNRLIQNGSQHEDTLGLLIKQSRIFLKQPKEQYNGFDWFVGVMYLVCGGNFEKTRSILSTIADLPAGRFIWPMMSLQHNSTFSAVYETQIRIIMHEVDHLDAVFKDARISVNGLTKYMLNQCFFNVLQWNEICHFLAIAVLYSNDYLVYFFISIFRYLKKPAIQASSLNDVDVYDKILRLEDYKIKRALPLIESLAKQYKGFFTN